MALKVECDCCSKSLKVGDGFIHLALMKRKVQLVQENKKIPIFYEKYLCEDCADKVMMMIGGEIEDE